MGVVSTGRHVLYVKAEHCAQNVPLRCLSTVLLRLFAYDTSRLHMDSSSLFGRPLAWLKRLGQNPYFWSGIGGLFVVSVGIYFLFNAVVMPSYTRHDASTSVPNVLDRSYKDAREVLEAQGLAVERQVGRYNPRVPQNQVVDQNPPPNALVKPGRRVYLTVNSGTAPIVSVPDLSGTSLREARNRLTNLGLEVGQERVDSIPSPYAQTVTRQRPAAGDSLKKGTTVDIWYSRGLGDEQVTVPDVRGVRVLVAEDLLLRRKLRSVVINANASTENASSDEERKAERLWVRQQSLQPGSTVRSGTEVRLFATPDSSAVPQPQAPPSLVDSLDVEAAPSGAPLEKSSFK